MTFLFLDLSLFSPEGGGRGEGGRGGAKSSHADFERFSLYGTVSFSIIHKPYVNLGLVKVNNLFPNRNKILIVLKYSI